MFDLCKLIYNLVLKYKDDDFSPNLSNKYLQILMQLGSPSVLLAVSRPQYLINSKMFTGKNDQVANFRRFSVDLKQTNY